MEKIGFIVGETFIYWNSVILVLAAAAAICLFVGLYLRRQYNGISAALLVPLAIVFSLVASRAVHWYCRTNAYSSLEAALTVPTGGGYALAGVFAGCIAAAVVLRLLRIVKNLPFTLDCMAVAAGAGIALGRLASLFNNADRGQVMEKLRTFPWVYPVTNVVTGDVEWRLATFMLQAMVAGAIFVGLLLFYLLRSRKLRDGDTACLFLCMYGASQVVLDSTRYDSLFLRSNGFVSLVQILAAVALVGTVIYFSVRLVKSRGFRWWYILLWVLYAACVGGAGFMEYWVQRHGDQAAFSYSVMSSCLLGLVILTCLIRFLGLTRKRGKFLVENTKK